MRIIATTLLLICLMAGCNSTVDQQPKNCIAVKYLRGICGQAVLKIQDPRYYDFGEDVDGDTHVFLATLECPTEASASQDNLFEDTLFYVELNPTDFNNNCAVCLAMVNYSGTKHYNVRAHKVCVSAQE